MTSLEAEMEAIGQRARAAAGILASSPWTARSEAISKFSKNLFNSLPEILSANLLDLDMATSRALSSSMLDRLRLDQPRVEAICKALEETSRLKDPLGRILAQWDTENGLHFERVAVPLGVVAVIFESR